MTECMICYNTNDTVAPCGSNTNCSAKVCNNCWISGSVKPGEEVDGFYYNCVFCKQIDLVRGMMDDFTYIVSEMNCYEYTPELVDLLEKTVYLDEEKYTDEIVDDCLENLIHVVKKDITIEETPDKVMTSEEVEQRARLIKIMRGK